MTPILPPRVANKDTVLPLGGGKDGKSPMFIPKGSVLVVHIHSANRLEEVYGTDADEFKPERWDNLRPGWVRMSCKKSITHRLTALCPGLHSIRRRATYLRRP